MTYKAIRLEVPFQKFLNALEHLTPDEKLVIRKKLEREKVSTWEERFGRALQTLGKKNTRFSEAEIEEDVRKAIAEVRSRAHN
ncbi:MAG: hypothetical protein HZB81_05160 [Deltaproteobacteria bacterium]|nr:hypothetical protein [Deltaproteobacteria bacterium]